MLIRQLEYFVAVAREQHFGRAADACYVSQPALSTAIVKLERELNVTLINRGQHFQGLTPAGARLVGRASQLLEDHHQFKAIAAALNSGISDTLRLGTGPTVSSTTTAELVAQFCASHPAANVQVSSSQTPEELLQRLRDSELDTAISHFETRTPIGLIVTPLYKERYVPRHGIEPGPKHSHHHLGAPPHFPRLTQTCYRIPEAHRFDVRKRGRDTGATHRSRLFRRSLRPRCNGRIRQRGTPELASSHVGDDGDQCGRLDRTGHHGRNLDRRELSTPSLAGQTFLDVVTHAGTRKKSLIRPDPPDRRPSPALRIMEVCMLPTVCFLQSRPLHESDRTFMPGNVFTGRPPLKRPAPLREGFTRPWSR